MRSIRKGKFGFELLKQYEIISYKPIYKNCKFYFRLQTRQWSDRVIRRETREWKVHGNMTIRKEVQVYRSKIEKDRIKLSYISCYRIFSV